MEENNAVKEQNIVQKNEKKDLITRLNRIEGQVRGIKNMVEEERYCVENFKSGISSSIRTEQFQLKKLLASHIHSCVVEDIRDGKDEAVDELCEVIRKINEIVEELV